MDYHTKIRNTFFNAEHNKENSIHPQRPKSQRQYISKSEKLKQNYHTKLDAIKDKWDMFVKIIGWTGPLVEDAINICILQVFSSYKVIMPSCSPLCPLVRCQSYPPGKSTLMLQDRRPGGRVFWEVVGTLLSTSSGGFCSVLPSLSSVILSCRVLYLKRKRLPLKNRLLLDTVRTWLDFSCLREQEHTNEADCSKTQQKTETKNCYELIYDINNIPLNIATICF